MKNSKLVVLLLVLMLLVTGCGNRSTKISDESEVLFTVGKIKFTKGQLYETLKTNDSAYTVINEAGRLIAAAEIETTDEIKAEADKKMDEFKAEYGDKFVETIQSYGYADEKDLYDTLINSVKSGKLVEKYIQDNLDNIYKKYSPVLAKILYIEIGDSTIEATKDEAMKAYEMILNGETFEEAAAEYATNPKNCVEKIYTTLDDLDLNVVEFLKSVNSPTLSSPIVAKNAKGVYVVQVTGTSKDSVEEKFFDYLKSDSDFTAEVDHFYFQKHNFQIYDVDVNNYVKELFPNYLPESK